MGSPSQTQGVSSRRFRPITGRGGLVDRYFYFALSLLMAGIVVWGFSHTADQHLVRATPPRPFILWFHAAAFSAWMAFYVFQSALVRTQHVQWHRVTGWFGVALGAIMVPLGVATSVTMVRFRIRMHLHEFPANSQGFLLVQFYLMATFGLCLALAVYWRRKPELHRPMLLIGSSMLLLAAFGRIPSRLIEWGIGYYGGANAGVDALILLGAVRDLLVTRRVHKVYLIALPAVFATQLGTNYIWLTEPAWWMRIAHALLR